MMLIVRNLLPYVLFVLAYIVFTSLNYYQVTHIKPTELNVWGWNLFKYVLISIPFATIANFMIQFGYALLAADKGANKLWMVNAVYYIIGLAVAVACTWAFYGKLPSRNILVGVTIVVIGVIICTIRE